LADRARLHVGSRVIAAPLPGCRIDQAAAADPRLVRAGRNAVEFDGSRAGDQRADKDADGTGRALDHVGEQNGSKGSHLIADFT